MDTNSNNSNGENKDINKDVNTHANEDQQQMKEEGNESYYETPIEEQHNQNEENSLNNKKNDIDGSEINMRKQKKQPGRFVPRTFITVLIILVLSILSVSSYVPVRDKIVNRQDEVKHYVESYSFSRQITSFSKYLVGEFHKGIKNEDEDSSYYNRYKNIESIKYHITSSRGTLTLSNLESKDISKEDFNKARFFLRMKTDNHGNLSIVYPSDTDFDEDYLRWSFIPNEEIEKTHAVQIIDKNEYDNMTDEEKQKFKEELADRVGAIHIQDEYGNITIEEIPIKDEELIRLTKEKAKFTNLEITYLIDDDILQHNDIFAEDVKHSMLDIYALIILGIGIFSTLILIIIAFSIRYSFQSRVPICHLFNKMYLELKVLSYALLITIGYELLRLMSDFVESSVIIDAIMNVNSYFYGIGITIAFIFLSLIYLLVVYIKYIYYQGIKEGLVKNSLLGRIILKIGSSCYRFFKQLMNIDVNRNTNRKLVLLSSISIIALLLLAIINSRPITVLLAIVYAAFLFKYLLKLIENVKSLSEASDHLAKGNFNIKLEEDMGMLSPVAKNLNNIKQGFSKAVNKATKSQKMKTELISNVSHDLKTPLTSIITYVDLLKNGDIDPQTQVEYIDILDKKAKRLKVLIEDLFEASKASSGNIDLQLEKLDVNALFRQTLGELEEKLNNSSLIIRLSVPDNKIMCHLDGRRIYRVFENIMSNILKYSMKGSRVYIDIVENEKNVQFIFKNISAYEMTFDVNDITDRFTRGDRSRNTDGSGLGLAIAKSLVELQNGKLTINVDGDLFKLTITFPKDDSTVDESIEKENK